MANANKIDQVYIELDAILDTRLGTIARISKQLAEQVLLSGKYHSRLDDKFEGVDAEVYRDLYKNRDAMTLAHSVVTNIILVMKDVAGKLTEQAIARPYHDGVKFVVNVYPYTLTTEEEDEIGKAIAAWMQGLASVELVSITPKDLTPSHCKQTYSMMIVYEYEDWMNLQAEAFRHTVLPEVLMLVPAIYFSKTPTVEELNSTVKEAAHPMRALEMLASPLIELKLVDVNYFSVPDGTRNRHIQPTQSNPA